MIYRWNRFGGNKRGVSLVEMALAVAVLGIVIIGVVRLSAGVGKSVTQSKLKNQVTSYAKAELDDYIRQARRGDIDAVTGELVPVGYNEIAIGTFQDNAAAYPRELTAATASSTAVADKVRLSLKKTVVVTAHKADGKPFVPDPLSPEPGEYRFVQVTLADTNVPERFSPITMETKVARPNELGLDARDAPGAATLLGRVIDAEGMGGIAGVRVVLGPEDERATATVSDGAFAVGRLRSGTDYTLSLSAPGYWPVETTIDNLKAGDNTPTPFVMHRVREAKVFVKVMEYNPGGTSNKPVEGASVEIDHPDPLPEGNLARNRTWYQQVTNAKGEAEFRIPIPVMSATKYPDPIVTPGAKGYVLRLIQKEGYLEEYTKNGEFIQTPIILEDSKVWMPSYNPGGVIYLYPVIKGDLRVEVLEKANGRSVDLARVQVQDATYIGQEIAFGHSQSGKAEIEVPLNTIANKTATSRAVNVIVQRMEYQYWETPAPLKMEKEKPVELEGPDAVRLEPHKLVVEAQPYSDPGYRLSVEKGKDREVWFHATYHGHQPLPLRIDADMLKSPTQLPGVASIDKREWTWKSDSPGGNNYPQPAQKVDRQSTKFVGIAEEQNTLDGSVEFKFTASPGGEYGPVKSFTVSGQAKAYFKVLPIAGGGPGTSGGSGPGASLVVSIQGDSPIPPGVSRPYEAKDNGALPAGISIAGYDWSLSGAGAILSPSSGKTANLTAIGPVGSQVTLQVVVRLSNGKTLDPVKKDVKIFMPMTDLKVTISPRDISTRSGNEQAFTANLEGGSGNYLFYWELLDSKERVVDVSDSGSISSKDNTTTIFRAMRPRLVFLRAVLIDKDTGVKKVDKVRIEIRGSGSSS